MKLQPTPPSHRILVLLRCAVALAVAAAATVGLARLALPALRPVAIRLRADGPAAAQALPLPDVLTAVAAALVLLCWTVLVAEGAAVALRLAWQVLRHGRARPVAVGPAAGAHRWPRRAALAALGLSLSAGAVVPAVAAPPGRPRPEAVVAAAGPLTGLPLPDRARGVAPPALHPQTVTVAPGDSLWGIAASLAGGRARTRDVARCWQRLLHVNEDRLGADPDLIFPGTTLLAPRCEPPREDRP